MLGLPKLIPSLAAFFSDKSCIFLHKSSLSRSLFFSLCKKYKLKMNQFFCRPQNYQLQIFVFCRSLPKINQRGLLTYLTFLGNYLRSLVEVNQANISLVVIELFSVLLLSVCLITCCQVIKQPRVHLHEGLKNIVDEGDDGLIPVFFAYPERNICLEKRSV